MKIRRYLAMTAAEIASFPTPLEKCAWMACHFSPYGTGLSNLPPALPRDSILILNDRIPICGHDPERIAAQLRQTVDALGCDSVLLDFQQENVAELAELASHLTAMLPCPTAVSDRYAGELDCPVFLSPCPHHEPLWEHLSRWKGREIWLDLAVDAETIILTKKGSSILPLPLGEFPPGGHREKTLHCHYSIETGADVARFTLWRTREDLEALAQEAEKLGITTLIGLHQEWKETVSP